MTYRIVREDDSFGSRASQYMSNALSPIDGQIRNIKNALDIYRSVSDTDHIAQCQQALESLSELKSILMFE